MRNALSKKRKNGPEEVLSHEVPESVELQQVTSSSNKAKVIKSNFSDPQHRQKVQSQLFDVFSNSKSFRQSDGTSEVVKENLMEDTFASPKRDDIQKKKAVVALTSETRKTRKTPQKQQKNRN